MENLFVLGTGNAMVTHCYNTCFALQNLQGILLVDAGGGNGILRQLESAEISVGDVRNMIVTHEHCDHLLGVVWVLRKIGTMMEQTKYKGDFHIWCHSDLSNKIVLLAQMTLQNKFVKLIGDRIIIHKITDQENQIIQGWPFTFFDIHSTKAKQFGFCVRLLNGKKLTCLGDEPFNEQCGNILSGTDILLSEAFCLYSQKDIFKPYEKHHSTVKDACVLAQKYKIPNLILWHTEDKNYENRQKLYMYEGKQYYSGRLFVPYDLDIINLQSDIN